MDLTALLQSLAAANAALLAPAALPQATMVMPRIVSDGQCASGSAEDGIVVCGHSVRDSRYRLPEPLRDQPSFESRNASWATRMRDEGSLQRFSGQAVGPSGYLQYDRQVECEWRAARQDIHGEQPDCTRKVRRPK